VAYARFEVTLPQGGTLRFVSDVAIDKGAVGQPNSDGVTFGVTARGEQTEKKAELHTAHAEPEPLTLDLTELGAQKIDLILTVHPGPAHSPSFDWARWYRPRIEQDIRTTGELVVASSQRWRLCLSGTDVTRLSADDGRYRLRTALPGALVLIGDEEPIAVKLPLDVGATRFYVNFVSQDGQVLSAPLHGSAAPAKAQRVGGLARDGIAVHPPDHGQTLASLLLDLPDESAEFHAFVGLRDGSKSEGCSFIVEANGVEILREHVVPGEWHEVIGDLAPWAGKVVLLSLITDSEGPYNYDWAAWGDPVVRPK